MVPVLESRRLVRDPLRGEWIVEGPGIRELDLFVPSAHLFSGSCVESGLIDDFVSPKGAFARGMNGLTVLIRSWELFRLVVDGFEAA